MPVEEDITLFSDVEGTLTCLDQSKRRVMKTGMTFEYALGQCPKFELRKVNRNSHPLEADAL